MLFFPLATNNRIRHLSFVLKIGMCVTAMLATVSMAFALVVIWQTYAIFDGSGSSLSTNFGAVLLDAAIIIVASSVTLFFLCISLLLFSVYLMYLYP